jgi:hypothetical protein
MQMPVGQALPSLALLDRWIYVHRVSAGRLALEGSMALARPSVHRRWRHEIPNTSLVVERIIVKQKST